MQLIRGFSFILICVNVLSKIPYGMCQKGRKRDLMEDIQKTVNSISNSIERNEQKLSIFESNIYLISSKMEKIVDSIDHNKLNNKFLDEKLIKIENKINTIEESMDNKINKITETVEQIEREVKRIDSENDAKLRKLVNLLSETYQLSKDTTILLKGRSTGYIGNGDNGDTGDTEAPDQIEVMKKKLLEQMSVMETSILQGVSGISKIGRETVVAVDRIDIELISLRDKCLDKDRQRVDKIDTNSDIIYPTIRNGRDSHQCPNVNMSYLKHEIESEFQKIGVKIENEMTIIESKIQEFMTSYNTNTNNGRSISSPSAPPIIVNTSSLVLTPMRRSITPTNKLSDNTHCRQRSSDVLAPKNCAELRKSGVDCDGVYIIHIGSVRMMRVYCDMTDNGGGWTVILRRGEFDKKRRHKISFEQDWNGYKTGFGDMDSGEFWLGLEYIHKLTAHEEQILQVDLESFDGDYVSIIYDSFRIGAESDNYRLHLGNPMQSNSTVAQSLIAHNTSMFSTHDRNNAIMSEDNCAEKLKGGWWFHNCHSAFLTAPYFGKEGRQHVWQGMQWHSWKKWHHLKAAQMKIKSK